MNTDKIAARALVDICVAHGVRHVVISPGSRNAPITVAFHAHPGITTYSIVDERSAAFNALGMALKSQTPTAVLCTSGSALLNFAPAAVEALYQHIPLIIISADRPNEWINQGIGQSINQINALQNVVKKSVSLPNNNLQAKNQQWFAERLINEALIAATTNNNGPVHINVPFDEPLYNEHNTNKALPHKSILTHDLTTSHNIIIPEHINSYRKILILVGQQVPDNHTKAYLSKLAQKPQIQVWTECTSNASDQLFTNGIDKLLATFNNQDKVEFAPELLITIGGAIVSKRVKSYLQSADIKEHWHITNSATDVVDTYQHLNHIIEANTSDWLYEFNKTIAAHNSSSYNQLGINRNKEIDKYHANYLSNAPYSDFFVFSKIWEHLSHLAIDLHIANSAAIRYAQLFPPSKKHNNFCNRGTSGIDGSTSTAIGSAILSDRPTYFITGDISFFYDSNAFWNKHIPKHFKVILINNNGGGIFRIIDGPDKTDVLDEYLETNHQMDAKHLCLHHNLAYLTCNSQKEIEENLIALNESEKATVLEIKTPRLENSKILKDYFKVLSEGKY